MVSIIIALLCCYIFRRCLVFIVLCVPLRIVNQRSRVAFLAEKENNSLNMCCEKLPPPSINITSRKNENEYSFIVYLARVLKKKIFCTIYGYSKYLVHTIKYFPSHAVRNWVYKYIFLVDRHPNSTIYFGCEIRAGYSLHIGKGSIIGDNCILDARQGIYIGENVNLSSEVHLWTESHDMNDPYFRGSPGKRGAIRVGNRAWLGANVTVLDNVTIGEGAVVCAGAVVTKNVEPFAVVAGIPAKKIGERSHDLKYEFDGSHVLLY